MEYHDTLVMNSRRLTDLRGRCPASESPWRRENDPPAWAPGDRLPRPAFIHELNIQPIDALGSHQPHRCRDRPAPTGSVHGAASRTARPPASATALRARPPFHSLVPDLPHQDLFLTIKHSSINVRPCPGLPLPSSVGRAHSARPGAPAKPREAIATRVTAYCVQLLCPRITQGALTSAPPGNCTAVLTRTHSASPSRPDGYVHTTPLGPCPGTRPPRSLQNALSLYSRMPSLST